MLLRLTPPLATRLLVVVGNALSIFVVKFTAKLRGNVISQIRDFGSWGYPSIHSTSH